MSRIGYSARISIEIKLRVSRAGCAVSMSQSVDSHIILDEEISFNPSIGPTNKMFHGTRLRRGGVPPPDRD